MATAGGRSFCLLLSFLSVLSFVKGMEQCDGNYWCEEGHCCGQGRCCTYYYEVWWFWLIWCMIALIVGCCFYQQKRLRLRRQMRYRQAEAEAAAAGQDELSIPRPTGVESPAIIQHAATTSTGVQVLGPVFDPDKTLRLPTYDEVENLPKDPPAYNLLYNGEMNQGSNPPPVSVPTDEPPPFDAGAYPALLDYNAPVTSPDNPAHVWAGLPAFVPRFNNVMVPIPSSNAAPQAAQAARDIHISNTGTIEGPSLISPPEYSVVPSSGGSEGHQVRSAAPPDYSLSDTAAAAAPGGLNDGSHDAQNQHRTSLHDVDDSPDAGLLANEVRPSSQRRH